MSLGKNSSFERKKCLKSDYYIKYNYLYKLNLPKSGKISKSQKSSIAGESINLKAGNMSKKRPGIGHFILSDFGSNT